MKKLIPKYQKGRWMRVKIKNSDPNKPGKYGYVDVDNNNRPWEWDESRPNLFMVHPESPNTEGYWTEIDTSSSPDFNHDAPVYDLSEVIITPKNREQIRYNREIAENNNYYNLFRNASDSTLRDWQLQNLRGSTRRLWFDRNGIGHYEFGEQGMSGTDPLGKFYVESVGFGKGLEELYKYGLYLKFLKDLNRSFKNLSNPKATTSVVPTYDSMVDAYKGLKIPAGKRTDIYSTTPDSQGYVVLGKIEATPSQLAYGEEIVNRLRGFGVPETNATNPYESVFTYLAPTGREIHRNLRDAVMSLSKQPTYIGYNINESTDDIAGEFYPMLNKAYINLFSDSNPHSVSSTVFHEGLMHRTDDLIRQLGFHKIYLNFLNKLFDGVTINEDGNYVLNGIEIPAVPNATNWEELRASLGEFNRGLYKILGDGRGEKLPESIKNNKLFFESIINGTTDEGKFLKAFGDINSYADTYRLLMLAHNAEKRAELLEELKYLMKYAPAIGGGAIVSNNKKGGRLIPKHQEGGTPNTFIGAVTELLGGDYEKGDLISALVSIHPLIGFGLGALDLGYDLNGLYHGDKTKKDIALDVFSLLPGIKYAKEINLLKKSKSPLMYYYKEISKYIKDHASKFNKIINSGKATDIIDDATH